MKIRDASILAYTKYRTRKARSILVVVGSSCITAIVLFLSIASAGLQQSVVSKASPMSNLNLLRLTDYSASSSESKTPEKYVSDILAQSSIPKDGIKSIYGESEVYLTESAQLSELPFSNSDPGAAFINYRRFIIRDEELLKPYVANQDLLVYKQGEPLPVLVSADIIEFAYKDELDKIKDTVKRVERTRQLQEKHLNKKQILSLKYSESTTVASPIPGVTVATPENSSEDNEPKETNIEVKIVGYTPSSAGFFSGLISQDSPVVLLGNKAAEAYPAFQDVAKKTTTAYVAFATKEDRQTVLNKLSVGFDLGAYVYGDISGSVKGLVDTVSKVFKWVILVMLLFVTLPMMSTMSKILADSQRETGVFRAIGARNSQIVKIYITYSALLATIAFLLALVIASAIALLLTVRYGTILGAQLNDITGARSIESVTLYGINPLHWLVLYVILLVSSVLGTAGPVSRTLRKDPIIAMRDE